MKIIEDILREVDQEVLKKAPHAARKYNKITDTLRARFLTKILREDKSIKKAAEELNINYSSAKTILTFHRKQETIQKDSSKIEEELSKDTSQSKQNDEQECQGSTQSDKQNDSESDEHAKALPPKNLTVNSFLSTASNLSELKDSFDESQDNFCMSANITPTFDYSKSANFPNSLSNCVNNFKKSFIHNKPIISAKSPSFDETNTNNTATTISSPSKSTTNTPSLPQKATSIIIPPPEQEQQSQQQQPQQQQQQPQQQQQLPQQQQLLQHQAQQQLLQLNALQNLGGLPVSLPQLTPALLLQFQQFQAQQQQQQQIQSALQQLLLLQNALIAQSNSIGTPNPLTQLLIQQQMLLLSQQQPQPLQQLQPQQN